MRTVERPTPLFTLPIAKNPKQRITIFRDLLEAMIEGYFSKKKTLFALIRKDRYALLL